MPNVKELTENITILFQNLKTLFPKFKFPHFSISKLLSYPVF